MCLCVCLCVSVCLWVFICICVHVSVCVCLDVCLCISVSVCMFKCVYFCVWVSLCFHVCLSLCVYVLEVLTAAIITIATWRYFRLNLRIYQHMLSFQATWSINIKKQSLRNIGCNRKCRSITGIACVYKTLGLIPKHYNKRKRPTPKHARKNNSTDIIKQTVL